MEKLIASIKKEYLVLIRDRAGLAILFLMPVTLVFIMSVIQDAPFRDFQEASIPLLIINQDQDSLGVAIERGLRNSDIFKLESSALSNPTEISKKIRDDGYALGILIPKGATTALRKKADIRVSKTLEGLGLSEGIDEEAIDKVNVQLFLDPATKKSFKSSLLSAIRQFTTAIENKILLESFAKSLTEVIPGASEGEPLVFEQKELIHFEEHYTGQNEQIISASMNSVQHNVPAWTMFAMFFIVIPLAGHMIKERDQGSTLRLHLMPGSDLIVPAGKLLLYVGVCMLQFLMMLLVGLLILPSFGLPMLVLGSSPFALLLVALASSFAATGYGIMIGTVFRTHQQAMSFGAVSIIILAAIGGIWVPLYIMPQAMQTLGSLSPLNWGLSGFNDIFLRGGGLPAVVPEVTRLMLFAACTAGISWWVGRKGLNI